jgi:rhomboid protease GluP
LDFSRGSVSLIKDFKGTTVLLEIIDGDLAGPLELVQSMEHGAQFINNLNGRHATIFKLFLFNNRAEEEKLKIITDGQVDAVTERKFLKSLSINIEGRNIQKHFSVPAFDANIVKTVKRYFSKNLDKSGATLESIEKLLERRKKDFDIQFKAKKPWLTYGLITINILVWLILKLISVKNGVSYDTLLDPFGAKVNSLIMQGEYWRFITPMFLHGDEIHLALNCYSLYIVGSEVERLYGHRNFSIIYFISGILGCIVSFAFSLNTSVGASGAIFGLLGAMLFFAIKRPALLKSSFGANLITNLVINLAYGFMNSRIDNHGHIGGLVGGFLTTGVVYTSREKTSRDKLLKIVSLIMVLAFSIAGLFYGFTNKENKSAEMLTRIETLHTQKNWTEAEKLGEEVLSGKPSNRYITSTALWYLTLSEFYQEKYDEAINHGELLTSESPPDGHYLLGRIYYQAKKYDKAREHLQKANELGSPNTEVINTILADIKSKAGQ